MSYIDFINNFWQKDLEATFSHLEVHLFFKLLEINNKLGWKNDFKYPNARLEGDLGTRPKNLIQARQRLVDFGVISYKKGTTRDAGVYRILGNERVTKESNQESNQGNNKGNNTEVIREIIRGTLNRQDKDKIKKDTTNVVSKKFDFKKSLLSYGFEEKLVDDWLLVRKNKKATNSETAYSQFILEVEKAIASYPLKINDLLQYIVAKSWSGYKANWDISEIWQSGSNQVINNQKTNVKNEQNKQSGAALGRVATSEQHRAVTL